MSQGTSQTQKGGGRSLLFLALGLAGGTVIGWGLGSTGLFSGNGNAGEAGRSNTAEPAVTFEGRANQSIPGGNVLDRLLEAGDAGSPERARLLLSYVDNVGSGDIAGEIDKVFVRRRGHRGNDIIRELYGKWVEQDPSAALAHALEQKGNNRVNAISYALSAWAAKEPYETIAWMEGHGNARETQSGAYAAMRAIAAEDPAAAIALFEKYRKTLMPGTNAGFLYSIWAEKDPQAAATAAMTIPNAQERDYALQSLASTWAYEDPQAVWKWGNEQERARDRDAILRSVIGAIVAEGDTAGAIAFLETMEPGRGRNSALERIVGSLATTDPEAAFELARTQSGSGQSGQAFSTLFFHWAHRDPERAFEAAVNDLDPGDARNSAIQSVINEVAGRDINLAREMVEKLDSETMRNCIYAVARAIARNDVAGAIAWAGGLPGGDAKGNAYSTILSEWAHDDPKAACDFGRGITDESLRDRSLQSALGRWANDDAVEAMIWAVENLEKKDQESYIPGSLLSRWVDQDVKGAADWVGALPEGDLRTKSLSNLVSQWARRDLTATGDWLNRLSPGEGRDAAVKRYAAQVFESDPEAALIWAGSLGVAEERTSEVEQLARRYLRNDPARAKRWIAASALPPETREQLLGQGNNR
jgi:hypothetical protein